MTFKTTLDIVKTFEHRPCVKAQEFCNQYPEPFQAIDAALASGYTRQSVTDYNGWHYLRWAVLSLSVRTYNELCDGVPHKDSAVTCADWLRNWLRLRCQPATL